ELGREGWVAEDPEVHLLPHIERAAAATGLRIASTSFGSDGVFDVRLEREDPASQRELREEVYALIGAFAEPTTSVVERRDGEAIVFEVATGLSPEQTSFAPHGHLVRLRVDRG